MGRSAKKHDRHTGIVNSKIIKQKQYNLFLEKWDTSKSVLWSLHEESASKQHNLSLQWPFSTNEHDVCWGHQCIEVLKYLNASWIPKLFPWDHFFRVLERNLTLGKMENNIEQLKNKLKSKGGKKSRSKSRRRARKKKRKGSRKGRRSKRGKKLKKKSRSNRLRSSKRTKKKQVGSNRRLWKYK